MDDQQHAAERQIQFAQKLDRWLSLHRSPYRIGPMGTTRDSNGVIRPALVLRFKDQPKGVFESVLCLLEHIEDKCQQRM